MVPVNEGATNEKDRLAREIASMGSGPWYINKHVAEAVVRVLGALPGNLRVNQQMAQTACMFIEGPPAYARPPRTAQWKRERDQRRRS